MITGNLEIRLLKASQSTGTTEVDSDGFDCSRYKRVIFVTGITTPAANTTVHLAQSTDNSSFADLAGTSIASTTSETIVHEIVDPQEKYVRVEILRGTTTVTGEIYAIGVEPRTQPANNSIAGTILSETHQSPSEGTA